MDARPARMGSACTPEQVSLHHPISARACGIRTVGMTSAYSVGSVDDMTAAVSEASPLRGRRNGSSSAEMEVVGWSLVSSMASSAFRYAMTIMSM